MTEAYTDTTFGGIDRNASTDVPSWYRSAVDAPQGASTTFESYHATLSNLRDEFDAETRKVGYYDDEAGEWVESSRFAALVNPKWLGAGRESAPQDNALWEVVTDSYTPTDHMDAFGPLTAVARRLGFEDVFGRARTYRNGGEVAIEILFDGLRAGDAEAGEDEKPIVLGFELGHDYYRRKSIYGSVMAYDSRTGTALRGLTKRFKSKHSANEPTERLVEWFTTMFERADKVGETIYEVVADSREYAVPMYDIPLSVEEFYNALGFASGMSRGAASRVSNTRDPSAYELYIAICSELTENYEGKVSGDALRDHASRANELLFSPPASERRALEAAADELVGQATLGTLTGEQADAAEALRERAESLDGAVSAFRSARDKIRTMLTDMADEVEGEGEAA